MTTSSPSSPLVLPSWDAIAGSEFAPLEPALTAFADALLQAPFRAIGPKTRERALDEIVLDSLAPAALGLLPAEGNALDMGCGPGIPLIPLALASPSLRWTGMDSAVKRLGFVSAISSHLGLASRIKLIEHRIGVYGSRELGVRRATTPPGPVQALLGRAVLVVARGTAPVVDVVAMASGFLSPGGRLLIYATKDSASAGVEAIERTDWLVRTTVHLYRRAGTPDREYAILEVGAER